MNGTNPKSVYFFIVAHKYLLQILFHRNYVSFLLLLLLLLGSLSALRGYWRASLFLQAFLRVFILFPQFQIIHYFFHEVVLGLFLVKCLLIYLLYLLLFILRMRQILVKVSFLKIYHLQKDMSFLKNHLLHHTVLLPSFHLRYPPSCLLHFRLLIPLHLILGSQTSLIHLKPLLHYHYSCTIHQQNLSDDMDKILANFSFSNLNDHPTQKVLFYLPYYYQSQDIHFHLQVPNSRSHPT